MKIGDVSEALRRTVICMLCGYPVTDWVDPDWAHGRICRECEAKHAPERHKPSLPTPSATPPPVKTKVAGKVDRTPVNKQAALIIRPNRAWEFQPPPMPPAELNTPERQEIKRLTAELKTERNDHALTRDALGRLRQEVAALKHEGQKLRSEKAHLDRMLKAQEETIRQLEDIKL